MNDDPIGFALKPEDAPDLAAMIIEQAELLQASGSEIVNLLHALDTGRDPSEITRRVRLWAEELHAHLAAALVGHEAIAREARSRRLLRVVYTASGRV